MSLPQLRVVPASAPVTFARPSIGPGEIDGVLEVLQSGWLTTGPRVHEFERLFAAYTGASHAVAVNSCTAALHLSLLAAGVGPGDEVVTTPLTFCATANAVLHAGARPVFADVDLDTMNLDPARAAEAVTPRTRAVLPVHFAGRPVDVEAFQGLRRAHGLVLVEDAAHAVESASPAGKVGVTADFTCFSFYATKNLTTGEGGMITTPSPDHAAWLRTAALHGMSRDAWRRYAPGGRADYDVVMAGFKYNMTDLAAAIGLRQLARLSDMAARRAAIWQAYDEALAGLPLIRPAPPAPGTVHARHLYPVLVDPALSGWTRDALQEALAGRGISTSVHFRALHLHPFYQQRLGVRPGMFPNAEYLSARTLSLPLSAALTDDELERTIAALVDLMR
ncbi:MAG: DegT/DnrJ/EryC1/StrS family aminotransferase [Vicinamibacterales bacterium]